ncbi:MAG TPA: ABC transporter permease [Thermopolyspora sp.]
MSGEPTGVIHDIGYRHYDGPRGGRAPAFLALSTNSLRGLFGLGRVTRAKIVPFALVMIMLLPAVVSIAIMAVTGQPGLGYTAYAPAMQTVLAIFLAAQSPYLVAPDLRFRVLPLYMSRPITVADYVGAKLAALIVAMFLLLAVPLTVLYAGELLVDPPGPGHGGDYATAMVMAVVHAVFLSAIGLALASVTPRRGLGVAAVIAFYLLLSAISGVLFGVFTSASRDAAAEWAMLINPFFLLDAVQTKVFGTEPVNGTGYPDGPLPAIAVAVVVVLGVSALILRYRKASAS